MKVSSEHEDWREVIYCGLENQQIDFKSAQDWNELTRAGRAKFARHAMALANTQGGYVVVGVREDDSGKPIIYQGMTARQASSFDPSTVGQTINRYADPAVSFDIVRPTVDGKVYVVLVVYPFANLPHVCGDACDDELQRGVFYVRTPEARSRAAYRASELQGLVQRAVRNQRRMLGRMLRGILYENRLDDSSSDERAFEDLLAKSRQEARARLGSERMRSRPLFELIVHPPNFLGELTLSDIRQCLTTLDNPDVSNFPRVGASRQGELYAANESLRGLQKSADGAIDAFWELYQSGLLYCACPLSYDNEAIQADELVKLCMQGIVFSGRLFMGLNCPDQVLDLKIRICNSNQILLKGALADESDECRCMIPDVEVMKKRSAGDLDAGAAVETAVKMYSGICERFNASLEKDVLDHLHRQLEDFLGRGML